VTAPARLDYPAPRGVPTHVTLYELAMLQRYAHEAGTVLEIGTLYGFTCIGMALAGAHVTSVDPHLGGPANAPSTWEPFLANCRRHGFEPSPMPQSWGLGGPGAIQVLRAPIEAQPGMVFVTFGMAFLDGDHVAPRPYEDGLIALAHLAEPGYVAYHDVGGRFPDVDHAVARLVHEGRMVELDRAGFLRVYRASAA
jgi:Methyltransferase domain